MPFRRRGGFRRGRTSRPVRNREWFGWTTVTNSATDDYYKPGLGALAANQRAATWIIDPIEVANIWDEPTVVRLLLRANFFNAGTAADITNTYRNTVRWGIIAWKGSTLDPATNSSALLGVDGQDPGLDWLYYDEYHFQHLNLEQGGTFDVLAHSTPYLGKMDIRTKRKLELGYGLAQVVTNIPNSTGTIKYHINGRCLILNH